MSGQAPALGGGSKLFSLNRDRVADRFRRALLIDDDAEYARLVSENLESINFKTTVVGSLAGAAQELSKSRYPIVLCDNRFDDSPDTKGSEFISRETELLGDSRVVLVTGWPKNQIVSLKVLEERGVRVIQKSVPGHIEIVKSECQAAARDQADLVTESLETFCDTFLSRYRDSSDLDALLPDPGLLRRARSYLKSYLSGLPDQDLAQFFVMGRTFSPKDLLQEIDEGSDVAMLLVDQLLDDILEAPNEGNR